MKTRGFIVSIITTIFLITLLNTGIVSAQVTCNDPNQTLFKLSSETNAHAEVWNGTGNYAYEVCYDDIFGQQGSGDRTCDGTNSIFALSATTNAHIEPLNFLSIEGGITPLETDYTTEVCYEGVTCGLVTGAGCSEFGQEVATISSQNNAHGQMPGSTGPYGFYSICCTVSGSPADPGDDGEEDPPTGGPPTITTPLGTGIYFINTTIEFNTTGNGDYEWKVFKRQGNGLVEEFTLPGKSFTHSFNTPGERIVRLKDKNLPTIIDTTQISMLIVGTDQAFASINKPKWYEIIPKQGNTFIVNYEAKESYVVRVTSTTTAPCFADLECLAGNCPANPINTPNNSQQSCNPVNDLQIQGSPAITGLAPNYTELEFKWSFDDGNTITKIGKINGTKIYGSKSNALHDKKISLLLNITTLNQVFEITENKFTVGQCINNGNNIIDLTDGEVKPTTGPGSEGNCALAGEGKYCCPAGHQCVEENGVFGCQITTITKCNDYTTEQACEDDDSNVVEDDPLFDENKCGKTIDGITYICQCAWKSSTNTCGFSISEINNSGNGGNGGGGAGSDEPCVENTCSYTYTTGQCIGGFMDITVDSSEDIGNPVDNVNLCNPLGSACNTEGESLGIANKVPCGKLTFQLSFFDYKQFIAVIIVMLVIYTFIYYNRKKRFSRE